MSKRDSVPRLMHCLPPLPGRATVLWGCIVHLLCPSSCVNVFPSLLHLQPETAEPGKQGGLKAWMMSGLLERASTLVRRSLELSLK